jgi:MYXO-CTERM domain-containing protein
MRSQRLFVIIASAAAAAAVALSAPTRARAASQTIAAGSTLTLQGDLVVSGADTLDANGTPSNPCVIVGNGHAIIASGLTGHVHIESCIFRGLGAAMTPAVNLTASGSGDVTINGSTFDGCGAINLHLGGAATAAFTNNVLQDNGTAYIQDELVGSNYVPAFHADGASTGAKVFAGNRVYRSSADFGGAEGWVIGGTSAAAGNVVIGHRGVISVRGNHVKVVGNFINPQYPLTSPDVENLVVASDDASPDLVVEHNVVRGGEWVLRACQGEVRYNVIADMNGHAWIKGPRTCNIHHNVFVNYANPDHNSEGGIDVVYLADNLNIYNNTFDGGGHIGNLGVPAIHAKSGRVIERVHSNAITNFIIDTPFAAISNLGPDTSDDNPPPGPARIHYADHNLFYNPDSPSQVDYSMAVEPDDRTPLAHGAPGFAAHDVHANPQFKGPLPTAFPYANSDIQAGRVTVPMMLAHYRDLYSPGAGSPLTGAGDPMGGASNNIGAVGQGVAKDPNDLFGTLQPGAGSGPPPLPGVDGGVATGGAVGIDAGSAPATGGGTGGAAGGGAGGAAGVPGGSGAGGSSIIGASGGAAGAAGTGGSRGTGGTPAAGGAPGAGGSAGTGARADSSSGPSGCGCLVGGSGGSRPAGLVLLGAAGLLLAVRRRRAR